MKWILFAYGIILMISIFLFRIYCAYKEYLNLRYGKYKKRYRIYEGKIDILINGLKCSIYKDEDKWKCNYNGKEQYIDFNKDFKVNDEINASIDNNMKQIQKANNFGVKLVGLLLIPIIVIASIKPVSCAPLSDAIVPTDREQREIPQEDTDRIITIVNINDYDSAKNLSNDSIVQISKEIKFTDINRQNYTAEELVGKKICMSYKGKENEDCLFIGQYDEYFKWDGECQICSYKSDKLYYCTLDNYVNGRLISFKRLSKNMSTNRWIYTEKTIDDNNLQNGDTWSYSYKIIKAKKYNMDNPQSDSLYTLNEAREFIADLLINHYSGCYEEDGNWTDFSGNAYNIKYNNGRFESVFKGKFVDNHYMEGWIINRTEDNKYTLTSGVFRDENANLISRETTGKTITKEEVMVYVNGEAFEKEITDCL